MSQTHRANLLCTARWREGEVFADPQKKAAAAKVSQDLTVLAKATGPQEPRMHLAPCQAWNLDAFFF